MGLGIKGLMADLRLEVGVQVNMDSSVARSVAARSGAGRVWHIEVRELQVQGRVANGELEIKKVKGEENVADGLTKQVERAKMDYYMKECGFVRRSGRHELCPRLGDDP